MGCLSKVMRPFGIKVDTNKTKVMVPSHNEVDAPAINIDGKIATVVNRFIYLGGFLLLTTVTTDIERNIALVGFSFTMLLNIWKCSYISNQLKVHLFNSLIVPIALYGHENWKLKTKRT
jgi:hypothetical protein